MNDAEIVRRVLAGDVNAYALLVDAHSRRVLAIVSRHVPRELAVEIAHETFVRAYEKLATFRAESPFEHWLSRIALRRCSDFWRGRQRSRETSFSSLGEAGRAFVENIPADRDDVLGQGLDALAERSETGMVLDWALRQLCPDDRMVLTMTHMDGQAVSQVADLLGWSVSKVKVRAHRARRKLREILGRIA